MSVSRLESRSNNVQSLNAAAARIRLHHRADAMLGRAVALLQHSEPPAAMLVRMEGADAGLVERTLSLLASGCGGLESHVECTLAGSCERAGVPDVVDAVLLATVCCYHADFPGAPVAPNELQRHLAGAAAAARWLASRCGESPRQAYAASIVRRVGLPALAELHVSGYSACVASLAGSSSQLHDVEQVAYGIDHLEVACHVLTEAGVPPTLAEWLDPRAATKKAALVRVSGAVAQQVGYNLGLANSAPAPDPKDLALLRTSEEDLAPAAGAVFASVQAFDRAC